MFRRSKTFRGLLSEHNPWWWRRQQRFDFHDFIAWIKKCPFNFRRSRKILPSGCRWSRGYFSLYNVTPYKTLMTSFLFAAHWKWLFLWSHYRMQSSHSFSLQPMEGSTRTIIRQYFSYVSGSRHPFQFSTPISSFVVVEAFCEQQVSCFVQSCSK